MAGLRAITHSRIDELLERAVDDGALPSVTAIAADRNGNRLHEGAVGPRVAGEDDPVSVDSHYRVMSMTKIVATTVALQLAERGKLDLDAPVDRYCPQFADVQVLDGFDGETPWLRPPASQATVRQLITHTTGLSYWFWNAEIVKWEAATGVSNVLSGLNEIFNAPLIADPGTRFEYGINIDWLGKVIEAASGLKLDETIRRVVTEPLGMDQTAFLLTDAQRANSVPLHLHGERGLGPELDWNPPPDSGPAAMACIDQRVPEVPAPCSTRCPAGGRPAARAERPSTRFTQPDRRALVPRRDRDRQPARARNVTRPGWKWGFGVLLNREAEPGHRRAARSMVRAFQHPLLGGPHDRDHGCDLQSDPPVRDRASNPLYLDFEGAVRVAPTAAQLAVVAEPYRTTTFNLTATRIVNGYHLSAWPNAHRLDRNASAPSVCDSGKSCARRREDPRLRAVEPAEAGRLRVRNFELAYELFGDPAAPALLLLPTWQIAPSGALADAGRVPVSLASRDRL